MIICLQDSKVCNPKGRDCIEEKSGRDFNCHISCEGIYADTSQWDGRGEGDVKKEEIEPLISEYKNFKRNNVHHFRFSSNAPSTMFGRFTIEKQNQTP